jgi:hypothetical protein
LYETCYALEKCRHEKNAKGMTLLKRFLYILSDLFLCEHCGEFYTKQLVLCSEETNFIDWVYDLKNLVTLKIFVTNESTKKCTLQVCPLINLSRMEFYDRLLYKHNSLSIKSWYLTIHLIRTLHSSSSSSSSSSSLSSLSSSSAKDSEEVKEEKKKDESIRDFLQTLQEMKNVIPYFNNLPSSVYEQTRPREIETFFENYLNSATIKS